MSDSTTIHEFPELRALAEEDARAFATAWESACAADWLAWERLDTMTRERRVAAHLTLLRDLSRPASRDAVCRLVAGRIRWTPATVVLAMETTGAIRERLHRDCGVPADAPTSGSATEALAIVVRHLWPEGALDAR